jgi:hypothetical protein
VAKFPGVAGAQARPAPVADYRAYTVGHDGHFTDCHARVCNDDRDAIDWAKQLGASHPIELWCGERFVVKFEPKPEQG